VKSVILMLPLKSQIQKKSLQQTEEITVMREEMAVMMADLKTKEIQSEALAEEVDSLPHDLTR
jgi:23S rRNA pseudoU1915 N3-methylase RlmH